MNICKVTTEGITISHKCMGLNFSNFDEEHIDIIVSNGKHQQKFWSGDKSLGVELSLK